MNECLSTHDLIGYNPREFKSINHFKPTCNKGISTVDLIGLSLLVSSQSKHTFPYLLIPRTQAVRVTGIKDNSSLLNWLHGTLLFYKNILYKNIEAAIGEILRILQ